MKGKLAGLENTVGLRRFEGAPQAFWQLFTVAVRDWIAALEVRVAMRRADGMSRWQNLPGAELEALAEQALEEGIAGRFAVGAAEGWFALPLVTGEDGYAAVLMLKMREAPDEVQIGQLQLVADTPAQYQEFRRYQRAGQDIGHFANILDLAIVLRRQAHFRLVGLALCDGIADRYNCQPVALGWRKGDYIRLQTLAQKPGFDRKMELVGQFEAAMEEALTRDDEVLWSNEKGAATFAEAARSDGKGAFAEAARSGSGGRAHEELAMALRVGHLLSLPLRGDGEVVGVLLCAREREAFAEKELRALRLCADHLTPVLLEKEAAVAWVGMRIRRWGEQKAKSWFNLEHPWVKLGAILTAVGFGVLFFGRMDYRVEAPFIVRPQQQVLLPAPFDGYVQELYYEVGDAIPEGAAVLRLDPTELALRVASLKADVARFTSEAERARGESRFAEMRVAEAQRDQAQALLQQGEWQLSQATLRAPLAGVLLDDGQLRERLGAPVSKGNILLRIAQLDGLYVELDVSERDMHEVEPGADGEIAFASRPAEKFPLRVERLDPVAQDRDHGVVFAVEGVIESELQDWWRPGMTGLAKIEAGRRTYFWVLTHRLVDWLHLKLWW